MSDFDLRIGARYDLTVARDAPLKSVGYIRARYMGMGWAWFPGSGDESGPEFYAFDTGAADSPIILVRVDYLLAAEPS